MPRLPAPRDATWQPPSADLVRARRPGGPSRSLRTALPHRLGRGVGILSDAPPRPSHSLARVAPLQGRVGRFTDLIVPVAEPEVFATLRPAGGTGRPVGSSAPMHCSPDSSVASVARFARRNLDANRRRTATKRDRTGGQGESCRKHHPRCRRRQRIRRIGKLSPVIP
jgi:hypothetical protein